MDKFILRLFQSLRNRWGWPDELKDVSAKEMEDHLIYNIYKHIEINLKKVLDDFETQPKLNLADHIGEPNKKGMKLLIDRRFVIDNATLIEKNERECGYRILSYKQLRYSNGDRGGYWKKYVNDEATIFTRTSHEAEEFLEGKDRGRRLMAGFLLLILSKYHIILHQHAGNEFRYLAQHRDRALQGNETVVRSQKIFTFTRLIAKYFPTIFAPNETKSKAIAKVMEITAICAGGFPLKFWDTPRKLLMITPAQKNKQTS
jgi:hypothetical protein